MTHQATCIAQTARTDYISSPYYAFGCQPGSYESHATSLDTKSCEFFNLWERKCFRHSCDRYYVCTAHSRTHARTHARTHTYMHTCTHYYAYIYFLKHTNTHTHTHARTHARTHTHTHSHARTHARTHTQAHILAVFTKTETAINFIQPNFTCSTRL